MTVSTQRASLYRTIWRWHFYAGLLVIPLIVVLAATGAVYLFKPQIDAFEERAFTGMPDRGSVSPEVQVAAALAAFPGARLHSYRLPAREGDAALVHLGLPSGMGMRDVFVSPQGRVLDSLGSETRIAQIAHDVHGQLLLGRKGSWLVELAASWAIVLIASGLYLWWPRGTGMAGVVWPRLSRGNRVFWRDLHAVTGFWVSGLALVLLLTGLPWADVWGSAFKTVRGELGLVKGRQEWTIGGKAPAATPDEHAEHAGHDHAAMMAADISASTAMMAHTPHAHHGPAGPSFSEIVAEAKARHLPFPVAVVPPGAPQAFGAPPRTDWTVRSDTQDRPRAVTLRFDARTGRETARETFADKHPIDRLVGYGVAWHEGALFGLANQLIGLATAIMLIVLAVSGFVMWRRRKPDDVLGAPAIPAVPARIGGVVVIVVALAVFLPMLAISLVVVALLERLVLSRIAPLARWLGLAPA
ncbi:PepSY domain-containing protein [Novosphingobium sp. KCTC 2891]|uniref:PepSY-associated TM helix domain-containing protein n=1 Tax=Novosphingobium sp. KCTC 2891 TaxID=2989730 RepID=UPI0022237DE0|nr:PepSY domain-containing protein [Novosphingobium sp. KCTC 2891]MCW1382426.1 PepSY domain-containing protein [Novosphingobium sp. KCTC 2891]